MRTQGLETHQMVEWAVASRAMPGEKLSGDRELVHVSPDRVLIAVVDALGHGPTASAGADDAVALLRRYPDDSVIALVRRCHAGLQGRRGVVMSLASFRPQDSTLTWVSVGNVEGVFLQHDSRGRRQRVSLITRGGIVGGSELPELRAEVLTVSRGDVLRFASVGFEGTFWEGLNVDRPVSDVADEVLTRHGRSTDDALVLVARSLIGT